MTRTHRTSALERLKELPEVFTLATAARLLACDSRRASTYIGRWKEAGLVSSLGPRAGVHFNLLKDPGAAVTYRMAAIAHLLPGAVIGGASAVHAAGWTTQFPRRTELLVPDRRTVPAIHGAEVATRPLSWFRRARDWILPGGDVPNLDPAFALADCVGRGTWRPDPDDIEWDEIDPGHLKRAFDALDAAIPAAWEEEIEDLELSRDQPDLFG